MLVFLADSRALVLDVKCKMISVKSGTIAGLSSQSPRESELRAKWRGGAEERAAMTATNESRRPCTFLLVDGSRSTDE